MRKRFLVVLALVCLTLLMGYLLLWMTAPNPRTNRKNYEMIREGMTEQEVATILGIPTRQMRFPKEWHNEAVAERFENAEVVIGQGDDQPWEKRQEWVENSRLIEIRFDQSCKVVCKIFVQWPDEGSFTAKVHRWFGL